MAFKIGKKVLVVNDPAQVTFLYFAVLASGVRRLVETDDDFQTTNPFDDLAATPDTQSGAEGTGFLPASPATDTLVAQADMLRIVGFGDFVGAKIKKAVGVKGITGVKQISTLTFTITSVVVGEEYIIPVTYKSNGFEGDFASNLSNYKLKRNIIVSVKAADTATTLATRFVDQLNQIIDSGWQSYVTATSSAGVVTLTATRSGIEFDMPAADIAGTAITLGHGTAVHAVTTAGYPGRNTYDQMKSLRLQTEGSVFPHGPEVVSNQLPLKGAKYSSYLITKTVDRADLVGFNDLQQVPSGDYQFEIFLNEATCATLISHLTFWLNANVAARDMYTATTGANALTGETVTSATTVDAASPFTTPLV